MGGGPGGGFRPRGSCACARGPVPGRVSPELTGHTASATPYSSDTPCPPPALTGHAVSPTPYQSDALRSVQRESQRACARKEWVAS